MSLALLVEQTLNGLQLGVMLFLMAAGLTLVFGVMNLINLAHGSLYMIGAFVAATVQARTGSFLLGVVVALPAVAAVGVVIEVLALRKLYERHHLDQVLATFGLILVLNEGAAMIWGRHALFVDPPPLLAGTVELLAGIRYPAFRLAVLVTGLATALGLWALVQRTKIGMLVRAGATNREMVAALGVDIRLLYTVVFAIGAALAALAGAMAGPLLSVEIGMGENILILTFVVVVIGGIGSIRGAMAAALAVGLADTFGRVLLPPGIAQMTIYLLMAAILAWRPQGLFPAHG